MTLGVVVDPVLKRLLFPKRIRNKNKNPNIITEICQNNRTENTSIYHMLRNFFKTTVLPAKSDSDVLLCLQSNQGLMIVTLY